MMKDYAALWGVVGTALILLFVWVLEWRGLVNKGRYILGAVSWISLFAVCWLVILGIVDLWPAAIFIVLFFTVGSFAPLYGEKG